MTTAIYAVEEMICQQWKAAVSQGVRPVLGVTEAAVDLDAGGRSPLMVMRGTKLGVNAVRETVENADFDLTAAGGSEVSGGVDGGSAQDGDTHSDRERLMSSMEGWDRHGRPNRGTGRGALASKTSRTGPVHFKSTRALVHCESTLQPAIASAGRRGPSRRKQ
jgi:copper chaperone